jgi:site-specific recombinase XerD
MPTKDFEARVSSVVQDIETSESIHSRNKGLILDYKRDQVLNGLKPATILKNITRMKMVAEHVGDQPLDNMNKSQVKDIVEWVHSRDYTEQTIYTYKSVIRTFWKWMNGGDLPDEAKWIVLRASRTNDKLPENLLTKEDIKNQVEATHNPRDKALIWMLYETGARIGEIIDLSVGSIEDRKHGKKVVIEGKTGARRLPLVESVPYINRWLSDHPSGQKDAPLWCKIQQGSEDDQLNYRYIREKILAKSMKNAGIEKPSNPHHYRHSRASYLANHLKEAQLCEWFGWVQGSDVPAKYVHLSGRDIDNAYDQMHGLSVPEDEGDEPQIRECARCQELNDFSASYCMRCGYALDGPSAADFEAKIESDIQGDLADMRPDDAETRAKLDAMTDLLADPDVKSALLAHMAETDS